MELLSSFTADQWGMVTSRQARTVGVDASTLHRLEKAGYVDRVRHGVYASNTAAVTFARDEQAAWLALNPAVPRWERPVPDPDGGVLSHVSATQLHGLGELPFERITFTTPRRRASRDEDLWFKRADLTSDEIAFVDGLPVTTVLRTICDLLEQNLDGSHIGTIIREAVTNNQVQLDVLTEHIGPYALRYGVRRPGDGAALLEHLLTEVGTSIEQLARRPAPGGVSISELGMQRMIESFAKSAPSGFKWPTVDRERAQAHMLARLGLGEGRPAWQHAAHNYGKLVNEARGRGALPPIGEDDAHDSAEATGDAPGIPRLPKEPREDGGEGDRR